MAARSPSAPTTARWLGFDFRPGDILISTRSKSGTTWVQMICALLVFRTADLPAPLGELSPWLDWLVIPRDEVMAQLEGQEHRRFIKTHTPLDGIPMASCATYIVVARDPLDAAVSLYHQGANLDRERLALLTGQAPPAGPPPTRPPLTEWLRSWIDADCDPREQLDSLPGVLWHLTDAWARRREPNVVLLHYDDLCADLEGEMRRLADVLGIHVPAARWPDLVHAARFEQMRARPDQLSPDPVRVLKDRTQFFRRGTSGAGREVLSDDEYARYRTRAATMAPPALLRWLHRDDDP